MKALKNIIAAVTQEEKIKSASANVADNEKRVTFDANTLNAIVRRLK